MKTKQIIDLTLTDSELDDLSRYSRRRNRHLLAVETSKTAAEDLTDSELDDPSRLVRRREKRLLAIETSKTAAKARSRKAKAAKEPAAASRRQADAVKSSSVSSSSDLKPPASGGSRELNEDQINQIQDGLQRPKKRTAQEAFGRNGVLELVNKAEAEASVTKKTTGSTPTVAPKATTTPGRTSMNDLLARLASTDEYQDASPIDYQKRPRVRSPVQDEQPETLHAPKSRRSRSSFDSLLATAKQDKQPTREPSGILSRTPPSVKPKALEGNQANLPTRDRGQTTTFKPANGHEIPSPRNTLGLSPLPKLEGLGTSPRIVQIRDQSPHGEPPSPLTKKAKDNSTFQYTTTKMKPSFIARSSFATAKPPSPVEEIWESIETAPAKSTASLRAEGARKNDPQTGAPLGPGSRFRDTKMSKRSGRWTDSEIIMIGYLNEVLAMAWSDIDRKMGRGTNTCFAKYNRVPSGIKHAPIKTQMRWPERVRAIQALINTIDLDIEQTVTYLQRYIDTDSLPQEAAEEFLRLSIMYSVPAPPVSILRETINLVDSSRASPASESDSYATIATTRKRRKIVNENAVLSDRLRPGARLVDGQLDVRAMIGERESSPDSVIGPVVPQKSLQSQKRDEMRLFDLRLDSTTDEDLRGWFIQRKMPYLSRREQRFAAQAISHEPEEADKWRGVTVHHDFTVQETEAICDAFDVACTELLDWRSNGQLPKVLDHPSKAQLASIVAHASQDLRLRSRTRRSIKRFVEDFVSGRNPLHPSRLRIGQKPSIPASECTSPAQQRFLRELGTHMSRRKPHLVLRDTIHNSLAVTRSFTGASGDVGNVAWSPSGTHFAAGSACLVDQNSMQYNQPNNLLFGNIEQNILYEVHDHHRERPKATAGVNALHSMHVSQDSRLFETVSMVSFSSDGSYMFSVGYDNYLRSYTIDGNRGNCNLLDVYNHNAKIDLLSVCRKDGLIATGSANIEGGVKVFKCTSSGFTKLLDFSSPRAMNLTDRKIMPSTLKWGVHSSVSEYLMAGFSSNTNIDINPTLAYGELCLWNVEKNLPIQIAPAAGNTFDCAWSPSSGLFASACAAYGTKINRGTKSLVRVYNPVQEAGNLRWTTRGLEMDCPALDINDVLFNPYNQQQVAAGATDGSVYVWDLRRPDDILHRLSHGTPLMELDPNHAREAIDTGVRFCAWADRSTRLYSGSSDGVLKVWDIHRATEDAHIRDVATFNSGIMSGAFTDDCSKLLVGEVNGSINLLELGADPRPLGQLEKFTLQPFDVPKTQSSRGLEEDSGVVAARSLLRDRKIEFRPLGGYPKAQAVQGPAYDGPHDPAPDAAVLRLKAEKFQQSMAISRPQCSIPSCKMSGAHFVVDELEESEESGRSGDRIPQAMRDSMRSSSKENDRMIPSGSLKCTHCAAPARVREDDMAQAAFPLCERCGFGCPRCGASCKLSAKVERVACQACGGKWDVGVLGYSKLKASSADADRSGFQGSGDVRQSEESGILGENGLGDLLCLVEEYYHSLWEDRPPAQY